MSTQPPSTELSQSPPSVRNEVETLITRVFFAVVALAAVGALGIVLLQDTHAKDGTVEILLVPTILGLAVIAAVYVVRRGRLNAGVILALFGSYAAVTAFGWVAGIGINGIIFGAFGLIILTAGALVGAPAAIGFGVLSGLTLVALYFAESVGWIEGFPAMGRITVTNRLMSHLLLIAVATLLATMIGRVLLKALYAAKEQERRFERLLSIAADWYWEQDEELRFKHISPNIAQKTGTPPNRHFGKKRWEIPDIDLTPEQWAAHKADLEAHRPFRNLVMRRKDDKGRRVWVSISGEPVFDAHGRFAGYWGVGTSVTERVEAEQRLRRSEAMLSQLFESSPDFVTLASLDTGRLMMVNEGFERLTGISRAEAVGKTTLELNLWYQPSERARLLDEVRKQGAVRNMPATLRRRDGVLRSMLFSGNSFEMDGEMFLVSVARDITRSEQERLEYEAILNNASVGIAFTRDRIFQHVNPRYEEMLGWPRGGLTGQPTAVAWEPPQFELVGRICGPLLSQGLPVDFEMPMKKRDGEPLWVRVRGRVVDPANPVAGGTIWIIEDITQRREFEQALAKAKEEAEAASRAKSAFLANTSHEIRTPLNGLLGLARLALEPRTEQAKQREYLKLILESGEQLTSIISDILDLSKIEAGKLTLEQVDFDLAELLDTVQGAYRELASQKGLLLALEVGEGVPARVNGDPTRVRQIVSNFVSNALKFTQRGRIDMRVTRGEGDRIRFAVSDTGIGLDEATRARLFTPFTQADESTTRRFGGTGLGLSICRQLALLMNGDIGVDSELGKGSTFWAEMPLPPVAAVAERKTEVSDSAQALAGKRVLVVEDNPVNLLITETFVANWGATVVTALNGQQAVEKLIEANGAFDAVLMDVHMPVMNGYDATRALRERWSGDTLPVIALTAAALVSEKERCFAAGMNDFVTKPVDSKRLRDVLIKWTYRDRGKIGNTAGASAGVGGK